MRRFCIIAFLVFAISAANASAKEVAFHTATDGFSINLPPGWVQIPSVELDEVASDVNAQAPKASPLRPAYAFQYAHPGKWFNYPYVLIAVSKTGRLPEATLRKIAGIPISSIQEEVKSKMPKLMEQLSFGQPLFDENTDTIWMYENQKIGSSLKISGVMVMIPTSYGIIQVQGYAREKDFTSFLPRFIRIVESVKLDPRFSY